MLLFPFRRRTVCGLALCAGLMPGPAALAAPALPDTAITGAACQVDGDLTDYTAGTDEPILLQADTLTYDAGSRILSAIGNVEVSQGPRSVRADMITYDEANGVLIATGGVHLQDESGPALYAERFEITGELKAGVIESLRLVLNENSRLAAARAVRTEEGITTLEKAVYSPCKAPEDGGAPLWQLKASRVVHDETRKTVSYRHARFEVYGVPILYAPYFTHPDPTVKRKTGFLAPSAGNSSELGGLIEVPYYIALQPNIDLTLSPLFTGRDGLIMKGEFRHRTRTGRYELSGSIGNARFFDEDTDKFTPDPALGCVDASGDPRGTLGADGFCRATVITQDRRLRGHLFGEGDFQVNPETQYGYLLQLTTDDTYLRRFDISREDRLVNNAYIQKLRPRGGRTVYNAYYFDGLRAQDDDATTPIVPALMEHRSVFDDPFLDGQFAVDVNLLSLFRTDTPDGDLTTNATDTQRASVSGTWERPFTSSKGDVITAMALIRGDVYYTRDNEREVAPGIIDEEDFLTSRALALAAVDWRWPFVRGTGTSRQVIEPIAQVIYSPNGGNPDEIPNEDGVSFEFDDTNLFSVNRFPGLDLWESGARANVGLRVANYGNFVNADVLVGQSFRLQEQEEFVLGSGLEDEVSDFVGRVKLEAGDVVQLTHRFRLDRQSFDFRRNEIDLDLDTKYIGLNAGYLSIDDQLVDPSLVARQEIRIEGRANFTRNWSIRAGGRRDLEDGEMINNYAALVYEDECTQFEGSYRRRFTRDRDIEPDTTILFRVRLRSVGS